MAQQEQHRCDLVVAPSLQFHPATPGRWDDLVRLFGKHGAACGCWCMYWRRTRAEWDSAGNDGNKQALKALIDSGQVPGLLAYAGDEPIGWCSVAPREQYGSLERSRTFKRIDARPTWSIVCFFVAKPFRRQGLSEALLRAAVAYVREQGGLVVEGYPSRLDRQTHDVDAFMGKASTFSAVGFTRAMREGMKTPIMRYYISEAERDLPPDRGL